MLRWCLFICVIIVVITLCCMMYKNFTPPKVIIYYEIQHKIKYRPIKILILNAKVTAYNSEPDQTDSDPYIAAWNNKVYSGMIAISRDLEKLGLKRGTEIYIDADKYIIDDRMHKRKNKQFDIWMENKEDAKRWGIQKKDVIVLDNIENIIYNLCKQYPIKLNTEQIYI